METIKLSNGKIRLAYEFNDLDEKVQDKVINDHINFEIEVMDENSPYYHCAEEMEKMQTPWFLGKCIFEHHKNDIIETIKLNYVFDIEGEFLPLIPYTGKNSEIIKYVCEYINKGDNELAKKKFPELLNKIINQL